MACFFKNLLQDVLAGRDPLFKRRQRIVEKDFIIFYQIHTAKRLLPQLRSQEIKITPDNAHENAHDKRSAGYPEQFSDAVNAVPRPREVREKLFVKLQIEQLY